MMKKSILTTAAALTALLLSGCICETPDGACPVPQEGNVLRLKLSVAAGTRANPTPGHDGDGREHGTVNESTVRDLNIFFVNDAAGLASDHAKDLKIKASIYTGSITQDLLSKPDRIDNTVTVDVPLESYQPQTGDHILVVANYGDAIELGSDATVSTIGDMLVSATLAGDPTGKPYDCTDFVMATANATPGDGLVTVTGIADNGTANTFDCETFIERLAGRVDFWYRQSNVRDGVTDALVYNLDGAVDDNGSKVYIEKIIPVNAVTPTGGTMSTSSDTDRAVYMLKHLSVGEDITRTTLCTPETGAAPSAVPTNYVVEPRTGLKQSTPVESGLEAWYGDWRATNIKTNYADLFSRHGIRPVVRHGEAVDANGGKPNVSTQAGYSFDRAMTLFYCNENTQLTEAQTADYVTGLAFEATYVPATVYNAFDATETESEQLTAATYTRGTTFWRVTLTKQDMKESEAVYFTDGTVADTYADHITARTGVPALVQEYVDGKCYYNLWLRHANTDVSGADNTWDTSDPHETFPMEYGIVRNNIYRVGIGFTGPGTPQPELRAPRNIRYRIFVRKWFLREFPPVVIE
jgi:hypothetical protein